MKDESDDDEKSKKLGKSHPKNNNLPKSNKNKSNEGGSELVANTSKGEGKSQRRKGGKSEYTKEIAEDQPCNLHSMSTKKLTHLLRDCLMWKGRPAAKLQQKDYSDESFGDDKEVLHTFIMMEKSDKKHILRVVNMTIPPCHSHSISPRWTYLGLGRITRPSSTDPATSISRRRSSGRFLTNKGTNGWW
jgi:hypothetical protein